MQNNGQELTAKLKRNIFGSSIYKGLDVLFNFLLVRYAIAYFGEEDYGVWLTILSVFTWFSVIEFGVGSSYRNKLTVYFADQKFDLIRSWVRDGYKAMGIIYFGVGALFLIAYNVSGYSLQHYGAQMDFVLQVSFLLYMAHYVFFFLQTILLATHHASQTYIIAAVQKGILLVGIFIFMGLEIKASLSIICLWFSVVPLLVWLVSSLVSYKTILLNVKPQFLKLVKEKTRPLQNIKKSFFIMQISTLIIYATDNLIIMNKLTGSDVTFYNVSLKYFNILIILFNIVLLPFWSSFSEAAHKKEGKWIKQHIKKLLKVWVGIALLAIVMLLVANFAYAIWIGKPVEIPFKLSLFMAVSVLITCWNNIFAYFLNSIAQTRIQMIILVFSALINVPLSIYLLEIWESTGVIIATTIALLPLAIGLPLHYRSIINRYKS